jgi:pimeloyl-ACP methyl ester carboxylesterase
VLRALALLAALGLVGPAPFAATCSAEDFDTRVSGQSQCLVMRRFGAVEPESLIVWLHGDVGSGGPANYHFAAAEQAATALSGSGVLSVALVRPGYPDGNGNASTVAFLHSGRSDHYTAENLTEVGVAIERLRTKFRPKKVIVIGHSGGAATTGVLLGLKPGLIDGAVLVACPCDIAAWRAGRREWPRSESPMRWVDKVSPAARVIALTGGRDDNTLPALAQAYVQTLAARNVAAQFRLLPDDSHNSAFRSEAVLEAVRELVAAK